MYRYRYGHRKIHKKRAVFVAVVLCFAVIGAIGLVIVRDLRRNGDTQVQGTSRTVGQVQSTTESKLTVDEQLFTMQLPSDWKERTRSNSATIKSITWNATKKNEDARELTLYIDTIPATQSVNRLLPVTVQGASVVPGDVSDNCATFTGDAASVSQAATRPDTPARWAGVDFICSLATIVDNKVGVGSLGGVNQVTLKGSQGEHKFFFLYTDHTIQPNYIILTDALKSFRIK